MVKLLISAKAGYALKLCYWFQRKRATYWNGIFIDFSGS
jgi:hypothetical protein